MFKKILVPVDPAETGFAAEALQFGKGLALMLLGALTQLFGRGHGALLGFGDLSLRW